MSIVRAIRYFAAVVMLSTSALASATDAFSISVSDWYSKDRMGRVQSVKDFIEVARANGVLVRNTPESYVKNIEALYIQNPEAAKSSAFQIIMRIVAVSSCDYTDGVNPLALAEKHLGDSFMSDMKKNLPDVYARIKHGCK